MFSRVSVTRPAVIRVIRAFLSFGKPNDRELMWEVPPTSFRYRGRGTHGSAGSQHAETHGTPRGWVRNPRGNTARARRRSRRRVRAMAHPFVVATKTYLDGVKAYYNDGTLQRTKRDLHTIRLDLETLAENHKVSTMSPRVMSEHDVEALLILWRTRAIRRRGGGRPLSLTSQSHLLKALNNMMCYFGNTVVEMMRKKHHVRFPSTPKDKPIRVLSGDELARIRRAADTLEGWRGSVARFLVAFLPATGLRPKEVRLSRFEDLDLDSWTVGIAHPKGEGSWASSGNRAVILPEAEQATEDFLRDRAAHISGRTCELLIPTSWPDDDQGFKPWSEASLRKIVSELVKLSGVRFSLKDFRSTFGQNAKDHGVSIEAVSRAMRHASTVTTERYYARMRPQSAFRELRAKFATPVVKS